jgi:hypothetical protein
MNSQQAEVFLSPAALVRYTRPEALRFGNEGQRSDIQEGEIVDLPGQLLIYRTIAVKAAPQANAVFMGHAPVAGHAYISHSPDTDLENTATFRPW